MAKLPKVATIKVRNVADAVRMFHAVGVSVRVCVDVAEHAPERSDVLRTQAMAMRDGFPPAWYDTDVARRTSAALANEGARIVAMADTVEETIAAILDTL